MVSLLASDPRIKRIEAASDGGRVFLQDYLLGFHQTNTFPVKDSVYGFRAEEELKNVYVQG